MAGNTATTTASAARSLLTRLSPLFVPKASADRLTTWTTSTSASWIRRSAEAAGASIRTAHSDANVRSAIDSIRPAKRASTRMNALRKPGFAATGLARTSSVVSSAIAPSGFLQAPTADAPISTSVTNQKETNALSDASTLTGHFDACVPPVILWIRTEFIASISTSVRRRLITVLTPVRI